MIILGLNAFHADSAAAIVKDGMLIAAAEEERFRRIKHWAGFPAKAIDYCLREAGVTLADVDAIALNQDSRANLARKLLYVTLRRPNLALILAKLKTRRAREGIADHLARHFPGQGFRGELSAVEHHLAHLSSAFHVSPFDEALAVSVDGFGDFASGAWGLGRGTQLAVEGEVYFPHSLGVFYQALTQYLGFPHYGDEYKIMGLAPYGQPHFLREMRNIVRLKADGRYALDLSFFRHHRQNMAYQWSDGAPEFADLFSPVLEELLGPRRLPGTALEERHRNIARSVQAMYEEAFFHLVSSLQERYRVSDIVLSGGCAANSVANGKIRRHSPFRRVYVQAAAGDAGGAIGAAYAVWHARGGARSFVMDHAYLGPAFSQQEISQLLAEHQAKIEEAGCTMQTIADEESLCRHVVDGVMEGKVVGWFQGRMEWGPRALGNRSILGDPRRADMKDILNAKIKRRESFRPFAPSVLEEAVAEWFEEDDAVPFMMQVFQIREEKRAQIPAVTHVDGSGRLQTVKAATNPLYHKLISAFQARTGVPMLLNTSFNENEPVVCSPGQALDCFLRTNMDSLVLGNALIQRNAATA
jgi:carbamoyltransferase